MVILSDSKEDPRSFPERDTHIKCTGEVSLPTTRAAEAQVDGRIRNVVRCPVACQILVELTVKGPSYKYLYITFPRWLYQLAVVLTPIFEQW